MKDSENFLNIIEQMMKLGIELDDEWVLSEFVETLNEEDEE